MYKSIGVAEIKKHFSEVVSEVCKGKEYFIIERKGKPMAAMVNIKELEFIERQKQKGEQKGLLAALNAWDDFKGLDEVIAHIYKKREKSKDRRIRGVL